MRCTAASTWSGCVRVDLDRRSCSSASVERFPIGRLPVEQRRRSPRRHPRPQLPRGDALASAPRAVPCSARSLNASAELRRESARMHRVRRAAGWPHRRRRFRRRAGSARAHSQQPCVGAVVELAACRCPHRAASRRTASGARPASRLRSTSERTWKRVDRCGELRRASQVLPDPDRPAITHERGLRWCDVAASRPAQVAQRDASRDCRRCAALPAARSAATLARTSAR